MWMNQKKIWNIIKCENEIWNTIKCGNEIWIIIKWSIFHITCIPVCNMCAFVTNEIKFIIYSLFMLFYLCGNEIWNIIKCGNEFSFSKKHHNTMPQSQPNEHWILMSWSKPSGFLRQAQQLCTFQLRLDQRQYQTCAFAGKISWFHKYKHFYFLYFPNFRTSSLQGQPEHLPAGIPSSHLVLENPNQLS